MSQTPSRRLLRARVRPGRPARGTAWRRTSCKVCGTVWGSGMTMATASSDWRYGLGFRHDHGNGVIRLPE
eukprot:163668-Chlamydomonas_euryale.AAC.3